LLRIIYVLKYIYLYKQQHLKFAEKSFWDKIKSILSDPSTP
jgi:hypothetical protein